MTRLLTLPFVGKLPEQGMEGAAVGIWCAHGEGRAKFPDPDVQRAVLEQGLAPIRCLFSLTIRFSRRLGSLKKNHGRCIP